MLKFFEGLENTNHVFSLYICLSYWWTLCDVIYLYIHTREAKLYYWFLFLSKVSLVFCFLRNMVSFFFLWFFNCLDVFEVIICGCKQVGEEEYECFQTNFFFQDKKPNLKKIWKIKNQLKIYQLACAYMCQLISSTFIKCYIINTTTKNIIK